VSAAWIRSVGRTCAAVLAAASLLAAFATRASAQTPQELAEAAGSGLLGTPAPALVVQTIDGESIDLGALYGKKAVYLKFWATWCVPCMRQMPHFEHAYETAGPDVAVIGVDVGFNDSLPDVRAVIAEKGLKMPTVIDDGRLAAAFNLRVTPQHVLIGRDGRVAYIGHLADEQLDAALRAVQTPREDPRTAGAAPAAAAIERFAVGDGLPDLTLATLDGRTFRARDAADARPTVLVFMSSWCESYFVDSRPELAASCRQGREQVAALAGRVDVRWLGVVSNLWERPAALRKYETDNAVGIPLALDESGAWFRAFDVMRTPTVVIADARGTIVRRVDGFDAGLPAEIERALGR
jgi:peroxiredoxin